MSANGKWFSTAAAVLVISSWAYAAPNIGSGIATFESYSEGALGSAFTDAATGIQFSASTSANHDFDIEYGNDGRPFPMLQNNKDLSANGYGPGDGAGFPPNFGFSASLPFATDFVEMDVLAAQNEQGPSPFISLMAMNAGGAVVATQTVSVAGGNLRQFHMRAQSSTQDILRFTVSVQNVYDVFDNIRFAPEPATGAVAGAILVSILTMRRATKGVN